jgi:hypothetical protein
VAKIIEENKEVRELTTDELDLIAGGSFTDAFAKAWYGCFVPPTDPDGLYRLVC